MSITLTLRNVPPAVARALRERARRNGHSMQKELLSILQGAALDRRSLADQLAATRALLAKPLSVPEIHDAIDEGRP